MRTEKVETVNLLLFGGALVQRGAKGDMGVERNGRNSTVLMGATYSTILSCIYHYSGFLTCFLTSASYSLFSKNPC